MTEETKNAPQPAQATAPAGTQAPAADLTVQDLGVIRSIIDVASTRGAFKANDMQAVGATYNIPVSYPHLTLPTTPYV